MHRGPRARIPFEPVKGTATHLLQRSLCFSLSQIFQEPQNRHMPFLYRVWTSICYPSLRLKQYEASKVKKDEEESNPTSRRVCNSFYGKYILAHCNAFVALPYESTVCVYAQASVTKVIT